MLQGEKAGDFTRYLSFHLDLDILRMNSAFSDESELKDNESDIRSETMSEMSDFNVSGYGGYGQRHTGNNPLSVSQIVASEDIDAAPKVPTDKKSEIDSKVAPSTTKRATSAGRGGTNGSSRLSGGSGGSRSLSGVGVGDLSSRTNAVNRTPSLSQVPSTGSASASGTIKRTSFGSSSSRSLSGGGSGGGRPTR